MNIANFKDKIWVKGLAVLLVITFINQDIVWAQGETPNIAQNKPQNSFNSVKNTSNPALLVNELTIPNNIASSKSRYNSGNDELIINLSLIHI